MRIWLTKDGSKKIEKLKSKEGVGDLKIEKCSKSGKEYFETYDDPFSPAVELRNIPGEFVEKVTVKDFRIDEGFRTEGRYTHDGAELMVKVGKRLHGGGYDSGEVVIDKWQDISISALTIEKLRVAYSKLRQGELTPVEDWEKYQHVIDEERKEKEKKVEKTT